MKISQQNLIMQFTEKKNHSNDSGDGGEKKKMFKDTSHQQNSSRWDIISLQTYQTNKH